MVITEIKGNPAGIYLFRFKNENIRTICEICSKLTIKTLERRHWCRSSVVIVNFEQISHIVVSIVDFEQVKAGGGILLGFSNIPKFLRANDFVNYN